MPHNLLIRLINGPAGSLDIEWGAMDDKGWQTGKNSKDLPALAKAARQVIILVPGSDVLLSQAKLPPLSPARMAKAIPLVLEDQLSEDTSRLQFAAGEDTRGAPRPIAIVSRERLDAWLAFLKSSLQEANDKITVLTPDTLAIPFTPGTVQVLIDNDMALVRTGKQAGFNIEKNDAAKLLGLELKRVSPKPENINISAAEKFSLNVAGISEKFTPASGPAVNQMSGVFEDKNILNLLQGDYARTQKKITLETLITLGLCLLALWFGLLTFMDSVDYVVLNHQSNVLDNDIKNIYARIYPGKPAPEDPFASLRKDLRELRASTGEGDFLRLVAAARPAVTQAIENGLSVNSAVYRNRQLILDAQSGNAALVDNLKRALEAAGLKVTVSNAKRVASGQTEINIIIEETS